MTKVVPVKMSDELYERLQSVAQRLGEADSTIIRLVLRAGLKKIVEDDYELFSFDEKGSAPPGKSEVRGGQLAAGPVDSEAASGRSRSSAFPPASLNEDTPREIPPPIPAREKTGAARVTRARVALRKMAEREKKQ